MAFLGFGKKKPVEAAAEPKAVATLDDLFQFKTEGVFYGLNIKPEHGYYVEVEPLDGDIGQVKLVDETEDGGYPPRGFPLGAGRPVLTEHLPTKMKWLDRRGHSIPDFDNGHTTNVSIRAKELIERIDPGVHQFVPVEYLDKSGAHLENRFFLFVCRRLDTFFADNPTMAMFQGKTAQFWTPVRDLVRRGDEMPPGKNPDIPAQLIIDSSKVGDAHIYVEKHSGGGLTFISEQFRRAIAEAGLTGVKPGPVRTL